MRRILALEHEPAHHVAHDADDEHVRIARQIVDRAAVRALDPHGLANRILAGPERARHRRADDRDGRVGARLAGLEGASAQERDAQQREGGGRDERVRRADCGDSGGRGGGRGGAIAPGARVIGRDRAWRAGAHRYRPQLLGKRSPAGDGQLRDARIGRERGRRAGHEPLSRRGRLDRDDALGVEPGAHGGERGAVAQQRGRRHQDDERDGHLRGDEDIAQPRASEGWRLPARASHR